MHTYIRTYMHTYIHTYIHTCIHACMHAYIHTYIHTYTHTYVVSMDPKFCQSYSRGGINYTNIKYLAISNITIRIVFYT